MRVLMAVDGSQHATGAMLTASRLLAPVDGRHIDLVTVIPAAGAKQSASDGKVRRRGERILESVKQTLANQGISANTVLKQGSAARALIGAAGAYDLAVVAAQSREMESSAGLGPVASRMLEHANCSVLVARETTGGPGAKILAAVDGSENALRGLEKMDSLVDTAGADVTLIHVVETPWLHGTDDQEWIGGYQEADEEAADPEAQLEKEFEREGESFLEAARGTLPARVAVSTMIARGIPADEILSEAERGDYDLIVLSASGSDDLKHQILGRVSTKVAWNAPCSVLLIRSTD